MRKDFRFGGSGGQGVISMAVLLANAYGVQHTYEVAQTQSYGPAARGGACKAELVISDEKIDGLAGVLLNFSHKIFGHLHRNAADLIDVITDFDSVALRGGVLNKR